MDKYTKGWERGIEMKRWRHRKGGLKAKHHSYLDTPLGKAMEDWICEQRRRGLRSSSIDGRRTHLCLFIKWCHDNHVTRPEWISRGLMEDWLVWLEKHRTEKGNYYADATKESMIRSVHAFFSYLLVHRRIDSNPLAGTQLRRSNGRTIPLVLDESQVLRLLEMPDTGDILGLRDRAMLEVVYSTGMRRSEVVGLRVTDLNRGGSSIVVHNGKGGKERVVPLGIPAQYWLSRYLAEVRPFLLLPDAPSDVLFLTSYGDGFSAGAWGKAVRKYLTRSGVTAKGGPHLLRHACATHMLDHGADLRTIQTLLGHSRVDTTEIYTHISTGRLSNVHHSTHPRG